jgi:hypothetical protein
VIYSFKGELMLANTSGVIFNNPAKKLKSKVLASPPKNEPFTLDSLVERARKVIFEAHSSFPKILYPDRIIVSLNRVTIIKQNLFLREEYPIMIDSVTGARVSRSLLHASLTIDTFGPKAPDPIRFLRISQARLARRYILALIECKKSNIDLSAFTQEELRRKLLEIGMVRDHVED